MAMQATTGFLAGGGAMGELIRAFDWAATPLGAPDGWPAPLRTVIRILLTTNHPLFVFWGPELRCFYNDAYSRSLGPEKHPAMLGAPGRDLWDEIWPIIGPQIEHVMAGRGATWHENHLVPIIRHGGLAEVYWTYGFSPIDDASAPHGVGGVLVLCTETTEQVLSAERMKSAEARWRALFDQAPGFVCSLRGPDHVFEFANPAYMQLIGGRDVVGQPVAVAMPWAADQGFLSLLDEVYRSGEPFIARSAPVLMTWLGDPPARLRYLDFVYQPIRDADGRVTGIFVQGSDVSDRRAAEEALRESEERLRIACAAAAVGIHDHDLASGRIAWDARTRELWGLGPEELVDEAAFVAGIHADDRAVHRAALERALDARGDGRYAAEFRVVHRGDGVARWIEATGQAGFEDGRATRLVGTVQDVSERKLAETRRNEFLATLGHELRNPLAPIRNAVEILKKPGHSEAAAQRARHLIERQLKQMVRLIDDLLDVVRVSRGRIELQRQPVSIDEVVALALESAAPHVDHGRHAVTVRLPAPPAHVHGDAVRLAQVFANLIVNACKYSERGQPIEVLGERERDTVALRVRDRGIGIAADDLHNVFEMFSQAAPSIERSQGGLGIGLSLAKGLVELHGGSIVADSAGPGRGSEFAVRLPVLPEGAAQQPAPAAARGDSEAMAGLRVLVVDDNADAAHSLAALLELDGAQVRIAGDGRAALSAADEFRPALVLLDIGLPLLNGYEVCRALRQREGSREAIVLALTGWGQEADRSRAAEAGFDGHFVKPVEHGALLDFVAQRRRLSAGEAAPA